MERKPGRRGRADRHECQQGAEIASNRQAMRAAILGDPQTAAVARDALLERPQDRAAVLAAALADPDARKEAAAHTRRAERADYVTKVLSEGKARTPSGQMIELNPADAAGVVMGLATVQDPDASTETVNEAYEFMQDLIADAVDANSEVLIREQRTKIGKGSPRPSRISRPSIPMICSPSPMTL
ncbi:hypothetical protein [Actinocorallia aurantiaca]|uniref:Uncharacterized protein n=1 Tax=Actinocorallia aurantiaca TaxID=46204 RepID=A0ABP6H1R2_9ACTN